MPITENRGLLLITEKRGSFANYGKPRALLITENRGSFATPNLQAESITRRIADFVKRVKSRTMFLKRTNVDPSIVKPKNHGLFS